MTEWQLVIFSFAAQAWLVYFLKRGPQAVAPSQQDIQPKLALNRLLEHLPDGRALGVRLRACEPTDKEARLALCELNAPGRFPDGPDESKVSMLCNWWCTLCRRL